MLSGGYGGARFLQGLVRHLQREGRGADEVSVIGNTADDLWLHGLKICPDLDTVMYTLGGGIDPERGWGRTEETWHATEELRAYGVEGTWFGLGDRDLATHLVRTRMLDAGYTLSQVTAALCARWQPGVRLLPMSDDRVETHVVVADPDSPSGSRVVHFQEYWVKDRAATPASGVVVVGADQARPAPGVLEAIESRRGGDPPPVEPDRVGRHDPRRPGRARGAARHPGAGGGPLPHRRRRARARHGGPAARRVGTGGLRRRRRRAVRRPQRRRGPRRLAGRRAGPGLGAPGRAARRPLPGDSR